MYFLWKRIIDLKVEIGRRVPSINGDWEAQNVILSLMVVITGW